MVRVTREMRTEGHGAAGLSSLVWVSWLLLTSVAGGLPIQDPCAIIGKDVADISVTTVEEAVACQKAFPFNLTAALATIDTLLKTIPFYVFVDIAKDSPEPLLPSKVDLEAGLKKLSVYALAGKFKTEYDFETAVKRLFLRLNDAHTTYRPMCFEIWQYTPTFVLYSATVDGKLKIKVAPEEFQYPTLIALATAATAVNLSQFYGGEVLEIDRAPALDKIKAFAETEVGLVKDFNARFNYALLSTYVDVSNAEAQSPGQYFAQTSAPAKSTVAFKIRKFGGTEIEVTLPYLAVYNGQNFTSSEDYFALNCAPQVAATAASARAGFGPIVNFPTGKAEAGKAAPPLPPIITLQSSLVSAFLLPDGTTGVVIVPTFLTPNSGTFEFWGNLVLSFGTAIEALKRAGAKRLILDVTLNGGGSIFAANWLVGALFPGKTRILPSRLRANPLAVKSVITANATDRFGSRYYWGQWAQRGVGTPFKSLDDGFFFPLTEETYGGETSEWSQFFGEYSSYAIGLPRNLVRPFGRKPPFKARNILILSNGFCGSACSIMSSSLSQFYGVRTVTVGGVPGHPQQISNFPGSEVLEFPYFLNELVVNGLDKDPEAPQPLPRNAAFRFTWRQLFGPASRKYPLEFVFEPSTFNLDYTDETALSVKVADLDRQAWVISPALTVI